MQNDPEKWLTQDWYIPTALRFMLVRKGETWYLESLGGTLSLELQPDWASSLLIAIQHSTEE